MSSAISGVHCERSTRKPSSFTPTAWPAYSRSDMGDSLVGVRWHGRDDTFARERHPRRDRQRSRGQQPIPVEAAERQLAGVIDAALAEQAERAQTRERERARQRLGLVVEVDEQRLAVAGLDETVGMAVEAFVQAAVRHGAEQVV